MSVENEARLSVLTSSQLTEAEQHMESKELSHQTNDVAFSFSTPFIPTISDHLNDSICGSPISCNPPPPLYTDNTTNSGVIMVNSMAVINPTASTIFDQPIMTPALGSNASSSGPITVSYTLPDASMTKLVPTANELPVSCIIDNSIKAALVGVNDLNEQQESKTVVIQDCKGTMMNSSYLSVISQPISGDNMLTECPTVTSPRPCRWQNCNRQFLNLDDLVNHVNEQHVKVDRPDSEYQCKWEAVLERQRFQCQYLCKWESCPRGGKGFNARYKMLIHIRTHTNEKPHRCSSCGKCFSRLENLKIHNRSHTGEKPYQCPFDNCNKAYSNSSDRFKHVRTHQEERPYICKMPGCNKRYTDPSSLRKHVRTHGHQFQRKKSEEDNSVKQNSVSLSILHPVEGLLITSRGNIPPHVSVQPNQNPMAGLGTQSVLSTALVSQPVILQNISTQTEMDANSVSSKEILSRSDKDLVVFSDISPEVNCQDGPLDLSKNPPSPKIMLRLESKDHILDAKFDTRWPVMVTGPT